jgi:hypothetical protein
MTRRSGSAESGRWVSAAKHFPHRPGIPPSNRPLPGVMYLEEQDSPPSSAMKKVSSLHRGAKRWRNAFFCLTIREARLHCPTERERFSVLSLGPKNNCGSSVEFRLL